MKNGLIMTGMFVAGICAGWVGLLPNWIINGNFKLYLLFALMLFVGIQLGCDIDVLRKVLRLNFIVLLVPVCVIIGSLLGSGFISLILNEISLKESLAVGSGLGFYSMSSILITQLSGEKLGIVALLANSLREVMTVLLAPIFVRYFGNLAPVASGGATSMDVSLPVIQKYSGGDYVIVAIVNGLVLTLVAPLLIWLILS